VTVGHGAVLNSCTIEDEALIGMGAIVMEGAVVERRAMLAAGAVVGPGKRVPAGQLWAGNPAQFVRDLTEDEQEGFKKQAESYSALAAEHASEFPEFGTAYLQAERLSKTK
jgi:carbonic anhydrase/acetyltransferase-like protein (isoleucine patch superfamily)